MTCKINADTSDGLKIVSDNQQHSVENIKTDYVKKLISKNINTY